MQLLYLFVRLSNKLYTLDLLIPTPAIGILSDHVNHIHVYDLFYYIIMLVYL